MSRYCLYYLYGYSVLHVAIVQPSYAFHWLLSQCWDYITCNCKAESINHDTNDLDFAGLICILTYETDLSNPLSNHLRPVTEAVVTVKSSMKACQSSLADPNTPPQLT